MAVEQGDRSLGRTGPDNQWSAEGLIGPHRFAKHLLGGLTEEPQQTSVQRTDSISLSRQGCFAISLFYSFMH
jgi:hypothetical protein